jgi:hypothetical protein
VNASRIPERLRIQLPKLTVLECFILTDAK